jgi:hypothetical protein
MTVWEQELCDASTQRATVHRGSLMDAEGRILRNGLYSVRVANNADMRSSSEYGRNASEGTSGNSSRGADANSRHACGFSHIHRSIKSNPLNMLDLSYSFVGV